MPFPKRALAWTTIALALGAGAAAVQARGVPVTSVTAALLMAYLASRPTRSGSRGSPSWSCRGATPGAPSA